jgi:hypothetical protein
MRTALLIAGLVLVPLLVAGCADPKHPSELVGTWHLADMHPPGKATNPALKDALLKLTGGATMTLNKDGTTSAVFARSSSTGKWAVDNQRLFMTDGPTKRPEAEPGHPYRLENGRKTLITSENGQAKLEMVFEKK